MRVLYFGTYERDYPRNAQVISCLRGAGVEVVERHAALWERRRHLWSLGIGAMLRVAASETRLLFGRKGAFDVMIVGYPGHFDMPAARRIARGRPVVFNPLVSLWDTLVGDRGRFSPGSPAAGVLRRIDRIAFRRADLVVADTEQHARFFAESFDLPRSRIEVCLVGAEDRVFRPGWQPPGPFHALFVGKLIPLHGLDVLLDAARSLPDVCFRVVGDGQLSAQLERRPPNVDWVRWVEYEQLGDEYRTAACALGIFGTSPKAGRVIPNKAYQALACGAPLVTGDTSAARELLVDGQSARLVTPGDAQALAHAIRRLLEDDEHRAGLAEAGLAAYRQHAGEEVLARRWRDVVERVVR